jgi:glutamate-5-semialdehyde dehydrogenase
MSLLPDTRTGDDIGAAIAEAGRRARAAQQAVALAPAAQRTEALSRAAAHLRAASVRLLDANAQDVAMARQEGASDAFVDRLVLSEARIDAIADGLEAIAALPDPLGRELARWQQPNGLDIARVSVPIGVIGIIFESRPNVTADAAGLCLRAGNATILRPGSESFLSAGVIVEALQAALADAGLPVDAVQRVPVRDRAAVGALLQAREHVDLIVPRGGKSLIARVAEESRIPVLKHLDGLCHVYLHESAEPAQAVEVTVNSKMRRTSVCGAAETLLVDRAAAARLLPPVLERLAGLGCELRGDAATRALDPRVLPADETDWETEYLDAILSIRQVDGLDQALAHIARYGSHHTDAIVAQDTDAIAAFQARVDSAIVLANASTQFADGGEFGMGAEIGISTDRLHARGPVGADQLTIYKYVVRGTGQVRP